MAEEWHQPHAFSNEARLAILETKFETLEKSLAGIHEDLKILIQKDQQLIGVKGFIYFLVTVASSLGVGTFVGSHFIK